MRPAAVAAVLLAVGGGLVLFAHDPSESLLFPPCPFHWLTGLYCPGCGSLRAAHSLLHGHLLAALEMNPLFVLSLPLLAALACRPACGSSVWLPRTVACVVVAFAIARNLPLLTVLAPH